MAGWPRRRTTSLRLAFALIVFAASLLAVFRAPTYTLWMASIAVTEYGHFLALVAMVVVLPGWRRSRPGVFAAALGVTAAIIALTPSLRARSVAERTRLALGSTRLAQSPGAPPHFSAFRVTSLFTRPASPDVGQTSITYSQKEGSRLDVDVYRREGARSPEPLVLVIHGGSWRGGTRADLPALNTYLAARGYVVASPSYRLAPRHRHPSQTEDINDAIDFLKANASRFGIDTSRIVLVGRSAGGQLALLSAYTKGDSAIRGVVSFYAPTDLKWGWDNPSDPGVYDSFAALRAFLGGSPSEKAEAYRAASPLTYAASGAIPTLLIHGSRDELVALRQSARLDSALSHNAQRDYFIEMPWATHGCDYFINGPCGQISTYAIERFIASVM